MKKLNLILVAGIGVLLMQACHNNNAKTTVTDSTVTTDVTKTDSTKIIAAADTGDANFAVKAAAGGMTEIAKSKLAVAQSSNAKIKDFANMMITDHGAAGDKLAAIAKAKSIALPTGPDSTQQNQINDLSKKTGKDFDKAYVDQMVKDTSLKSFVINTIPVVQHHLAVIKTIKSDM